MQIDKGLLKEVTIPSIKFTQAIIPTGRKRRPGINIQPKYITIHNTGCHGVPADNFRRVQLDPSQDIEVSWHFTVDEKEIVQHLPITEVGWHAGNREGNYTSFAIEVCERPGAEEVAIKFVAELLKMLKWDVNKVRTHKSWSGKQCPWKILPHWDIFLSNVREYMVVRDMALEKSVQQLSLRGIIGNPTVWNSLERINLKNVPSLIYKMGGVDKLVVDGVIGSRGIWNAGTYTKDNVRSLIIKYADYLG